MSSVDHAPWLDCFIKSLRQAGIDFPPHVSFDDDGEATLEWWYGTKSLTMTIVNGGQPEVLRSWGLNIFTDMDEPEFCPASLWRWLHT